jgi:hypothetical protein
MKLAFDMKVGFLRSMPIEGVGSIMSNMCITLIGMRLSRRDDRFETE